MPPPKKRASKTAPTKKPPSPKKPPSTKAATKKLPTTLKAAKKPLPKKSPETPIKKPAKAAKKPAPKKPTPKKTTPKRTKEPVSSKRTEPISSGIDPDAGHTISNPTPRTGIAPSTVDLPSGLTQSEINEFAGLEKLLNIKWSIYVPHSPTAKQLTAMMLSHIKEVFFGGALGGGKSDWLAYEALRYCDLPGFSAIIFRRQLTDLKQPGSLIPRIGNWLSPFESQGLCKYIGDEHAWIFKTTYPGTDVPGPPARLQFGYIGEASVRERYQSAEYQLCPVPETLVLMADGSYKQIGNILPGDFVQTLQGPSIVTRTNRRQAPCVQVTTPYGTQIHSTTHKLLTSELLNPDDSTAMRFHSWQELSSQRIHKSHSQSPNLEMSSQDYSHDYEQSEQRQKPSSSALSSSSAVKEIDSLTSDDELQEFPLLQELSFPLMLAVLPSSSTDFYSKEHDLSEDAYLCAPSQSVTQDSRIYCSSYNHPYDERASLGLKTFDPSDPTSQADAALQNHSQSCQDAKEHTRRYNHLKSDSYAHPYTKEICHHDQTISGHQLVSQECSQKALQGSFEVTEITVANHSHYITSSKLVNMNCCFDELGQWPTDIDYLFMRSRIRSVVCNIHGKDANHDPIWNPDCNICNTLKQIPLRMRAASNPGPAWIKRRFGIIPDPKQFASRHEAMIAISEGRKVNWIGTIPGRPFIPSYLDDNPHLDAKNYREMLREMSEEERSRLEDGNWESRKNARFKRRWQRFYSLNEDSFSYVEFMRDGSSVYNEPIPFSSLRNIFTTSDPAVTVKAGPVDDQTAKKSSSGVISTWGVTHDGQLLWLDCRKFRKEIPDFVAELVKVNSIWHPRFNKIECNGVGIGVAQYAQLAGLPVQKNYRKTDKLENSLSAQMLMQDGRIYFPINAPWGEEIEDDVFNWTGLPTEDDDVIDTLADAASELTPALAREISAPETITCRPIAVKALSPYSPHVPHYGLF